MGDEVKKEITEEEKKTPELDKEDTIVDYNEGDDLSKITHEMLPVYRLIQIDNFAFFTWQVTKIFGAPANTHLHGAPY